jgi:nucleoside-diphosphate-sugar epimerase
MRKIIDTRLPLPIDGIQVKRAYLHIDRLTEVLATLAAHDWPAGYAETFEVADPEPYTLKEIFAAVAATEGRALRSFPAPAPILKAFLRMVNKVELMDQIFRPLAVSSIPLDNFLTALNRKRVDP